MQLSATERLADFTLSMSFEDLPQGTIDRTKQLLLDQLGCQLAFADLPWSRQARSYALGRSSAAGLSTVVAHGDRVSGENAAFVNAVSGHGFELDDTEMSTASHPGAVVIPAALALAEEHNASGSATITAITIGYELMIRAGRSAPGMMQRGFHTTAAAGPFGAAAVAGRMFGLSASQVANAFGIAASQSSGITEYTAAGGSVKRFHPGFAATSGIRAAALAALGVDAPSSALEGSRGFIAAFSGTDRSEELFAGLGSTFMIDRMGTKPYCCCAGQHAAIDALASLMKHHGLLAQDVEVIEVFVRQRERSVVGKIRNPKDVMEAQFSAAFGLALRMLVGSNGYTDYSEANIQDGSIRALAQRVHFPVAPDASLPDGDAPARVVVTRRNGTQIEATVEYASGTAQRPSSWKDIESKFMDLISGLLTEEHASKIIHQVHALDEAASIRPLMRLLMYPEQASAPRING